MPAFFSQIVKRISWGLLALALLYTTASASSLLPAPGRAQFPDDKPPVDSYKALIVSASRYDASPPLISLVPKTTTLRSAGAPVEIPNLLLPKALRSTGLTQSAAPLDHADLSALELTTGQMPDPLWSFDGVSNLFGGWPPDTQGDIGPNHYVQWINLHFAVWQINKVNHTATRVYGPAAGNTLFTGFGGACETSNDGDPVTLYDPFADRWFMSQFALPNYPSGPFYECVAVSTTPDPTSSWYRYEFLIPVDKMDDYPKFGVWPDAYYMTVNQFTGGTLDWGGAGVAALERSAMLTGAAARMVYFDLYSVNANYSGILPADFDGINQPPTGAPGYFSEWDDSSWIGSQDALRIWKFQVDWLNPSFSTFGLSGNPNWVIPTQDVDPDLCGMARNCILQPGTTNKLDAISDRLMYRLQYRNYGGYETLVSNHTVDENGADHAGIHWFELRKQGLAGAWSLYQEGIYAPDSDQRWMGSLALDHTGNLALGYSVSGAATYPSVRYAGRLIGDPPGALPQSEKSLVAGTGAQTGANRWGDYSMMGVDPVDDCTFWYTQEYVAVGGSNTWTTRIGAFRFPSCTIGPQGVLSGTVTSQAGPVLDGALVRASLSPTQTFGAYTDDAGDYQIVAPIGVYTVTASAFGFYPQEVNDVEVFSGTHTTRNFTLLPAPAYNVSGVVSDALTGWPLYARIVIPNTPLDPVWSDPVTGYYSVTLPAGVSYSFEVESFTAGYLTRSESVGVLNSDLTRNLPLQVNTIQCQAAGYQATITPVFTSTFEQNNGGLSASGVTTWAWGTVASGPGSAHSGTKAWATNPTGDYQNSESGATNLSLNLSAYAGQNPIISWWQYLKTESRYDFASLEVSKDGGTTWTAVYGPNSGDVDLSWKRYLVTLDPSYAVANFKLRFKLTSDTSIVAPGWYLDDLLVGPGSCLPQAGSLLVGAVYDANTVAGLTGAQVVSEAGASTIAVATPADPRQADGFFSLFSMQGTHTFTATYGLEYAAASASRSIPLNQTLRQDFNLQAGRLHFAPTVLQTTLQMGDVLTRSFTLTNTGGLPAQFELLELAGGFAPFGPLEKPNFVVKPFKQDLLTSRGLGVPAAPPYAPLIAGQVLQSWSPVGSIGSYAAAYTGWQGKVWVSSPSTSWEGNDHLYEYSEAGVASGRSWSHTAPHSSGPADLAYNWHTGNIWVMNVNTGIANCIYEVDPDLGYTGAKICPGDSVGFSISQRGLAYDSDTDTWFAGGWNDLMIHRFDNTGAILSSVNVGLGISGLAYNPDTKHLFVMTSASTTRVYVLDVANNYTVLGQITIGQGFGSYAGAGMEIDCAGNLWAPDLNTNLIYQFSSGESSSVCSHDVTWLTTQPVSGTLTASAVQPIKVRFDAGVLVIDQPGAYTMQLKVKDNTPYTLPNLPVTMTVTAPATWGSLNGLATSQGYCDTNPAPLANAQVLITASSGLTWTTTSNAAGYYQRWLDEMGSPYTLTVSLSGYLPDTASGVIVTAGMTTTVNFDLPLAQPCISLAPQSVTRSVKAGKAVTSTLSLENKGHTASIYQWDTYLGGLAVNQASFPDWLSVSPVSGTLAAQSGPQSALLTLNANDTSVSAPGVYTQTLLLTSDDQTNPAIQLPITLTVLAREYGVTVSPDQTGAQVPGEAITYSVALTNTSDGLSDLFNIQLSSGWLAQAQPSIVGPLASGASAQVKVRVVVPESALPSDLDRLVARAISQGDSSKQASWVITTTAATPLADLAVSKSASAASAWLGQPLTYTISLTNTGPTSAIHATLVDVLPSRVDYLSNDAGCSLTDHTLVCDLGSMAIGERRTIHILVRPMGSGVLVNQAFITSDAADPNPDNNWAVLQTLGQGYIHYLPLIMR